MSLYGLDLVKDQAGGYHLLEINGICSGMEGFKLIYGDNRVGDKVYGMLQQRYGKLTVNDGAYRRTKFNKEHPLKSAWYKTRNKVPFLHKRNVPVSKLFSLPTARMDWLKEVPYSNTCLFPFESYIGQDSAVLSTRYNEELPHPLVNPYLTEEIASNKFFTYQVLKDSSIADMVPKSTILGLGFTHEDELAELSKSYSSFVIKPLLGLQGKGIEYISKEDAKKHQHSRGPANVLNPVSSLYIINPEDLVYVEDLVQSNIFSFSIGLGIIQPFIDSRRTILGAEMYTSIRAIVCNEQFVDAYLRVSPGKTVNLAQGAQAYPCQEKYELASLSEKVVAIFEEECFRYDPGSFRQELYGQYIKSRGETTSEMRKRDASRE